MPGAAGCVSSSSTYISINSYSVAPAVMANITFLSPSERRNCKLADLGRDVCGRQEDRTQVCQYSQLWNIPGCTPSVIRFSFFYSPDTSPVSQCLKLPHVPVHRDKQAFLWDKGSFSGQPEPVPHHPHGESFLPNIQPKPTLFQFESIPLCPSPCHHNTDTGKSHTPTAKDTVAAGSSLGVTHGSGNLIGVLLPPLACQEDAMNRRK